MERNRNRKSKAQFISAILLFLVISFEFFDTAFNYVMLVVFGFLIIISIIIFINSLKSIIKKEKILLNSFIILSSAICFGYSLYNFISIIIYLIK